VFVDLGARIDTQNAGNLKKTQTSGINEAWQVETVFLSSDSTGEHQLAGVHRDETKQDDLLVQRPRSRGRRRDFTLVAEATLDDRYDASLETHRPVTDASANA
jgi:hypothetical protein